MTARGLPRRRFLRIAAGVASVSALVACGQGAPAAPTQAPPSVSGNPTIAPAPTPPAQPAPTTAPAVATEAPKVQQAATPTVAAQPKAAAALPDDAAPPDQQVFRLMEKEDRYVVSGIGGYNVMWDIASS